MGSTVNARVNWKVTILTGVYFFLDDCKVVHGQSEILIIDENCYSETMEVARGAQTGTSIEFSYKTFQVQNEVVKNQKIICGIVLCAVGDNCGKITHTNQCPSAAGYSYSLAGFTG